MLNEKSTLILLSFTLDVVISIFTITQNYQVKPKVIALLEPLLRRYRVSVVERSVRRLSTS